MEGEHFEFKEAMDSYSFEKLVIESPDGFPYGKTG
jgi:hypothetical protein